MPSRASHIPRAADVRIPRTVRAVAAVVTCLTPLLEADAQDFGRVQPPVALHGTSGEQPAADLDPGRPVQMLESPNVDRFLRKAHEFLGREDYPNAIRVLQDVIEGHTLRDPTADIGREPEPATAPDESAPDPATAETASTDIVEGAETSVFSGDGRLYHPVRRLCHQLLASLPPAGAAYYRSRYEVEAERELAAAEATGDPLRFESIYERFFLTHAAGRAMRRAGDLLMDAGRLRGAIRAYRLLLDVYPDTARQAIGLDDLWIRFRIAACFGLLGEPERARAELAELTQSHPDASLRLEGELVAIRELEDLAVFGSLPEDRPAPAGAIVAFETTTESLVPLFEHRFADLEPYRAAKASGRNRVVMSVNSGGMTATPRSGEYLPGTTVTFADGRLALMNHFRLEVLDLPSGRMVARNEGELEVPTPQPGMPRTRIPAYDFASLRVVSDDLRHYVVVGPAQGGTGMKAVMRTSLEAYARGDLEPLWSTDSDVALAEVTFLAAPTVFGSRLLVPVARRDTFGVMCLEAATGALQFFTPIHSGGTDMSRPPAVPIAESAGVAYVLTNAGAVAAIDAFSGTIRWIRRYERAHPFRPPSWIAAPRSPHAGFGGRVFQELPLFGFAPSDIVLHDGLVIIAPADGGVLICLDGASGEPIWMVERGDMQYVIGDDGDHLYMGGPDDVTCIALRSGLRLWRDPLPAHRGSIGWRGRGTVSAGRILMPGDRELLVRDTAPGAEWQVHRLPSQQLGREPLQGEFNVFHDGVFVVVAFQGGVEAYSTVAALTALAEQHDDPLRRASLQAHAGDLTGAIATLEAIDLERRPERRPEVALRMLTLCSELALALASHGERDQAISMLDRCRDAIGDGRLLRRWHLARIEVFQALGDLNAVSREQEELYELMGKNA